ncbi:MAG: HAMP domain-containing histidine kinase [Muribaculaceae bacterium]|nr:HAMP domain-containing histidine kinase [Muribaculaceae bacterium]
MWYNVRDTNEENRRFSEYALRSIREVFTLKFKTRLLVISIFIIVVPLLLTAAAFMGIGIYMVNSEREYGASDQNYTSFSYTLETYNQMTEDVLVEVRARMKEEPGSIEDIGYLEMLNKALGNQSSYIIVRKNDDIYYTGNRNAAERIFTILPEYRESVSEEETGYYYHDMKKLVKQLDFMFLDGAQGSFFIITRVGYMVPRTVLIDMVLAFVLILIFTSMVLTRWMQKGVFTPINQLNTAMQNIAEGNLEYRLASDEKGEIGELYRNYEDMRLRLKESTDEKIEQEKQNRELISNISHDLKTPITAVKGYVEGIMDGVADTSEKMDKYIKTIYNKANDMDRLINELTLYSGFDNNRIPYNFHRINVAEYFGDCVEEVGLDLESKNIQLNYEDLVSPDTQIIADPEQMKRVINNIIGNSVKYLDTEKGVIDIRILDEVDSIRVEIEDNGRGIAAKDLPNIFERFYRTDASRNSAQGGSGIGLSIVKKIIEDHGGYIWATSKEKEGTCMHFVIRKYQEPEQEEVNTK